jgi:uncharacterized membrane protein
MIETLTSLELSLYSALTRRNVFLGVRAAERESSSEVKTYLCSLYSVAVYSVLCLLSQGVVVK